MSISNLYSSGQHKRHIGHFASIVKLALSDDFLEEHEQKMLNRVAKRLNLSDDEVKEITKNPDKFPINPPVDYNARIERLYSLTNMVFADGEAVEEEAKTLQKIVVGLGFPHENAEKVADEAIHLVMNDNDLEDFTKAIKSVNKI